MFFTARTWVALAVTIPSLFLPAVTFAQTTMNASQLHTGAPRQIVQPTPILIKEVPVLVPGPERVVEVIRVVPVPSKPRVIVRDRVVEVPGPERIVEVEKVIYRDRTIRVPTSLPHSGPGLALALLAGGIVGGVRTVRKSQRA